MAEPNPSEVAPWYLRNITQALELDEATGNVFVRTNASIVGNVSVGNVSIGALGNVNISGNTLPVTISSGNVTVYQGTTPWVITGNTNAVVSGTVAISGNIAGITALPPITGAVTITGNANVAGNVGIIGNIAGITSNVVVTDGGGSLTVDGTVGVSGTVNANITGGNVAITSIPSTSTTAWQEPYGIEISPVIQFDAAYGLTPLTDLDTVLVTEVGNGNVYSANAVFYISSGNTAGDIGSLRSTRHIPYRSGQGCLARFTAAFTEGVANSVQRAGMTNAENAYLFGYQNDQYGIGHVYNGRVEIRTLTINTAPTGTQTATITLNSTVYSVPITAGTTSHCAAEIAAYAWPATWRIDQINNTVLFTALNPGPRSGTYSFSSTGSGTLATGTFAQTQAGVATTLEFTPSDQWDYPPPAGFSPQDLNVYQVQMKWLGAGSVRFSIENPDTGQMQLVHTQKWIDTGNVFPHASKPNMRVGWNAAALGTLASPVTIAGCSAMGAVEGVILQNAYSVSVNNVDTTTRAQNNLWHVLSVRNPNSKYGQLNTQEIVLQDISFAFQGNDPVTVYLFANAEASDDLVYVPINTTSVLKSGTTGLTIDINTYTPVVSFTVPVTGSGQFNLIPYRLIVPPGQAINVGFFSTGQVTRTAVGITLALNG